MRSFARHVGRTYAVFTAILAAVFLWAFSFTPLGEEIENRLFDLRAIVKPDGVRTDGVRVLTVSQASFEKLRAISSVQIPLKSPEDVDRISLNSLERIVRAGVERGYRSVNIVLTMNPNYLLSEEMETLVALARQEHRVRLGVLETDSQMPSTRELLFTLRQIDARVFSADTFGLRATNIVRQIPQAAYRGPSRRVSLPAAIGGYEEALSLPQKKLYVNYVSPSNLLKTDAVEFLEQGVPESNPASEDLILAYGQIDNRRRFARYSYVNTPWNDEREDLLQGVYIPDFVAISALNFRHQSFLSEAPKWVEPVQTLLLSLVFGLIWIAGSSWAFSVILCAWAGMLVLHGFLFTYGHFFVPLGQSTLVAIVAGIVGSQWRLKQETKLRIAQETETRTKRDFVGRQTSSLSRYADGLMQLNEVIRKSLRQLEMALPKEVDVSSLIKTLYASADELREYLNGMVQIAGLSRLGRSSVRLAHVSVHTLMERVIAQFQSRSEEKDLRFSVEVKAGFVILVQEKILENIIFNFISNAVRFSPDGGMIRIVAGRRGLRKAFIRVEDEGPGIPSGQEDLIFDKFYQIAGDKQSELKGHGLGLYLSRFFAEFLKGSVSVIAHEGKGAWFEIKLPLRGGRR